MKLIDMSGQRFGKLTVLYKDNTKQKGTYWICQCDCGNIISCRRDVLLKVEYPKRSCGCDLKEKRKETLGKNELNKKYGYLTVIEAIENKDNKGLLWKCQCDCGNIVNVRGINLRNGSIKSCGCLRYESKNGIDETGHIYGDLTVLFRSNKTDGSHIFWTCQCSCGNICEINGTNLRNGISTNCGCKRSLGEAKISNLLEKNNINFKKEYTFPDLIGPKGGRLRFDFAIFNNQNQLAYLIEFDGIQHFKANCFGKNINEFNELQYNDQLKNEYCMNNNIKLIRIPYTKLSTLSINDIIIKGVF